MYFRFIGGGVLRNGSVQEEIRFIICPELLISLLFYESMLPTEAIIIIGCEQYNKYTGYASTFTFAGNFVDNTPIDTSGRRMTCVSAIDAIKFSQIHHQFRESLMLREIKKAYVGFHHSLLTPAPPIASGNWGCGAFKGSPYLKCLLQLIACVTTGRPLVYFTFGDSDLRDNIFDFYTFMVNQDMSVSELWHFLQLFSREFTNPDVLYHFIAEEKLNSCLSPRKEIKPNTATQSRPRKTELPVEVITAHASFNFYGLGKEAKVEHKKKTNFKNKDLSKNKLKQSPTSPPRPKQSALDILDERYDIVSEPSQSSTIPKLTDPALDHTEMDVDEDGKRVNENLLSSPSSSYNSDVRKYRKGSKSPVDVVLGNGEINSSISEQNMSKNSKSTNRQKNLLDFFTKKS